MLTIDNIHKTFFPGSVNEKRALQGVSLTLQDGDFATVIGSNGAGKSTLLNAIAGAFYIDQGQIRIDDIDVTRMPEHERAQYIGRVFQDPMKGTASKMMIEENLALASWRGKKLGLRWSFQTQRTAQFKEALKELGLGLEDGRAAGRGTHSQEQLHPVPASGKCLSFPQIEEQHTVPDLRTDRIKSEKPVCPLGYTGFFG